MAVVYYFPRKIVVLLTIIQIINFYCTSHPVWYCSPLVPVCALQSCIMFLTISHCHQNRTVDSNINHIVLVCTLCRIPSLLAIFIKVIAALDINSHMFVCCCQKLLLPELCTVFNARYKTSSLKLWKPKERLGRMSPLCL